MTIRQRKFAEYYVQFGNAAKSAVKAGYSKSYAEHRTDEMLRNVEVAEYINLLSERVRDERIMTARERQALLSDMAKDTNNEPSDRIRAIDTLNKMTGEYTTKITAEVKTSEKLADVLEQLGGKSLDD